MKNNIIKILTVLYVITTLISIYVNSVPGVSFKQELNSLPMFVILILYLFEVRKINYIILIGLLFTIIGNLIFYYDNLYLSYGLIFYGVSYVLCSVGIIQYRTKKIDKSYYINYLSFVVSFGILYLFVLNVLEDAKIAMLFYGLSLCALGSLVFGEYLSKMNKVNLILFCGVFMRFISDAIFSVNLFSEKSMLYDVFVVTVYFISQYLVFKGFILKQNNE